jgi:hypothetical protein
MAAGRRLVLCRVSKGTAGCRTPLTRERISLTTYDRLLSGPCFVVAIKSIAVDRDDYSICINILSDSDPLPVWYGRHPAANLSS